MNKEKIANYCKLYHRGYKRATPPRKKKLQPVLPPQLPPLPLRLDVIEEELPFNIMIDNRPHTVRFD
jgi:hypothetical protein